jgi:zinc transport system substrate-binding protein
MSEAWRSTRYLFCVVSLAACFAVCQACSRPPDKPLGEQKLKVVTTLFPLYDFARSVGGERADVSLLLPPGVEPHSFEPKPGDVMRIEAAGLFIYTGGNMEPWAATILKGFQADKPVAVDTSAGIRIKKEGDQRTRTNGPGEENSDRHHRHNVDPHIWLDLDYAQKMVDTILNGYVRKDPGNRDFYRQNAERYKAGLAQLDDRFQRELATCTKRVIIHGGHFAFNYLAKRYGITYVSAYGGSPDSEPTARALIELEKQLRKYNVRYVYFEELITPRVAQVIAKETGASLLPLHGAHNVSREELAQGVTFISIMEQNLKNLKVGMECQ